MNFGKALGVAALLVLAAESQAGVIQGRVRFTSPPAPPAAGGTAVEPVGVEQSVLWVDSLPPQVAGFYHSQARQVRVIQSNRRFAPKVTTVMVGSTIRFMNRDKVYHNVFSVSPAQRFDLGKYPPRASQEVTFEHPGIVNLFCDIHPWMAAYVVVLPHRVFTRPNRAGNFKLPLLPPGRYTLHLWHPDHGELLREVELPERGDVTVAVGN